MIKKAYKLFDINFKNSLNTNKKKKYVNIFIGTLFFVLSIVFFQYSFTFGVFLKEHNLTILIFPAFILMGYISIFAITSYKSRGALFGFKDVDLLFSMPIPESSILIYKIANMMTFNYVISFFTVIPVAIAYRFLEQVNNTYWLYVLLIFIFNPFIPTLCSSLVGYIIGLISSFSKRRSIVETIGTLLIIYLFTNLISHAYELLENLLDDLNNLDNVIKHVFYPLFWVKEALSTGNILYMFFFVILNIVSLIVFVLFMKKSFIYINKKMKESFSTKNFELKELKCNGKISSILKKELTLYTQSSIYMLNTCFGSITMILFGLSSFFIDTNIITATILDYTNITITNFEMLCIVCGIMAPLSCTSPSSISMEGSNLWICRSMPVKEMSIFLSKMTVDFVLIIPANILALIMLSFNFSLTMIETLALLVLIVISGISMSEFGILLNLKFPKLKYKSEVDVVKESTSARLAVYIPLVIALICGIIYATVNVNIIYYLWILSFIFSVISLILFQILRSSGIKKFKELYC